MEWTAGNVCAVCLIELTAFFIKGISGFGEPLFAVPMLSLLFSASFVTPVSLVMSAPLTGYVAWKNRREFSARQVFPMGLCLVAGMIPGAVFLKYMSDTWWLKAVLGTLVILVGLNGLIRPGSRMKKPPSLALVYLVCFLSGISGGVFGISLYFVPFVERYLSGRGGYKGGICFIFIMENMARIVVYAVMGLFSQSMVPFFACAVPCMIAGMWLGSRVERHMSDRAVRYFVHLLFLAGGLSILTKAILAFIRA